jgi:hypothetical protein
MLVRIKIRYKNVGVAWQQWHTYDPSGAHATTSTQLLCAYTDMSNGGRMCVGYGDSMRMRCGALKACS